MVSPQNAEQAQTSQTQADAAWRQAVNERDLDHLNLERSEIKAPANGIVTNLELRRGNYVSTGKAVVALVDTDSLRVKGYFEETKLPRIHVGDPVTIRLMGEPTLLRGRVQSVAAAIEDRERVAGTGLLTEHQPHLQLGAPCPARARAHRPGGGAARHPSRGRAHGHREDSARLPCGRKDRARGRAGCPDAATLMGLSRRQDPPGNMKALRPMRHSQHTDSYILYLVYEADASIFIAKICSTAHISLRTFCRWRKRWAVAGSDCGCPPPCSPAKTSEPMRGASTGPFAFVHGTG